jgi:hypothetical protein
MEKVSLGLARDAAASKVGTMLLGMVMSRCRLETYPIAPFAVERNRGNPEILRALD